MNRKRYNKSGIKGIPAVCVILTMLVCCGIMAGCSVDTVPVSDTQTAVSGRGRQYGYRLLTGGRISVKGYLCYPQEKEYCYGCGDHGRCSTADR